MLVTAFVAIGVFAMRAVSSEAPSPDPMAAVASPAPIAPRRPAQSYFAAPSGVAAADGSHEQPLDLTTALSSKGPVAPGDTLWLRGGTYKGSFASELSGSADATIYVKAFPGEHVVLDGAGSLRATLEITGPDVWFWGLEVTNSDPQRTFDTPSQGNTRRATGVAILAPRVRLVDLAVHDAFTGVMISEKADGSALHGCLIFRNGIQEPQGGVGHGILLSTIGRVDLVDVVTFNNQGRGINAGAGNATGRLALDGLVSFNNGQSAGGDAAFRLENLFVEGAGSTVRVTNSHLYHAPGTTGQNVRLDNRRGQPGAVTVADSILVGGSSSITMANWREATVTGNRFYLQNAPNPTVDQTIARVQTPNASGGYTWNSNGYVDQTERGYPFIFNQATNSYGGGNLNYNEWRQANKFDGESRYGRQRPTGVEIFVRRDEHDPGRGVVVVYNWDREPTVLVSLDALGLEHGQRVDLVDVNDPFGHPAAADADASQPIEVSMQPVGSRRSDAGVLIQPRDTRPEFAVFVVRPSAGDRTRTTR